MVETLHATSLQLRSAGLVVNCENFSYNNLHKCKSIGHETI
jgi:hypothetical protein